MFGRTSPETLLKLFLRGVVAESAAEDNHFLRGARDFTVMPLFFLEYELLLCAPCLTDDNDEDDPIFAVTDDDIIPLTADDRGAPPFDADDIPLTTSSALEMSCDGSFFVGTEEGDVMPLITSKALATSWDGSFFEGAGAATSLASQAGAVTPVTTSRALDTISRCRWRNARFCDCSAARVSSDSRKTMPLPAVDPVSNLDDDSDVGSFVSDESDASPLVENCCRDLRALMSCDSRLRRSLL